jgi:hypothetical protein
MAGIDRIDGAGPNATGVEVGIPCGIGACRNIGAAAICEDEATICTDGMGDVAAAIPVIGIDGIDCIDETGPNATGAEVVTASNAMLSRKRGTLSTK